MPLFFNIENDLLKSLDIRTTNQCQTSFLGLNTPMGLAAFFGSKESRISPIDALNLKGAKKCQCKRHQNLESPIDDQYADTFNLVYRIKLKGGKQTFLKYSRCIKN